MLLCVLALGGLAVAQDATAANRISVVAGANGTVRAISEPDANGVRYLGGDFTAFDQWSTGGGALVSATTAKVNPAFPKVTGTVNAVAGDGAGGFYIGGLFTQVDGVARINAAHINADGSVDESWNPSPNDTVSTIEVSGSLVYLGGAFTTVGGQTRNRAAAVGTDGTLASWNPNVDQAVQAMAISGTTVYLGGLFTTVGGVSRNRIAAVGTDGTLSSWDPNVAGSVLDIAVAGSTVYFTGNVTAVGGVTRTRAAAVGTDGTLRDWAPALSSAGYAIAVSGSTVYLGGIFTGVNSQPRGRVAAVGTDGVLRDWNPNVGVGTVYSIAVSGSTVYLGGGFTTVGGVEQARAAAVGPDGALANWNPAPDSTVFAIAISGASVYLGGQFTVAGGVPRNRLAAVDQQGILTDWNPGASAGVRAIAVSGSTVYVGGSFATVAGQARNRAAAVGTDGTLAAWNPDAGSAAGSRVHAIAVSGSTVYLGGTFTTIGGSTRSLAAAVGTDGTLLPWNPSVTGTSVNAIVVPSSESRIFLGGSFFQVGGSSKLNLAAVETSGSLSPFFAEANAVVNAITLHQSTMYIGGSFTTVAGIARNRAAAVDTDGTVKPWDPNVDAPVHAITGDSTFSTVFLGGAFSTVGGEARNRAAAVSTSGSGTVLPSWNPNVGNITVFAIRWGTNAFGDPQVLLGGDFTTISATTALRAAAVSASSGGLWGGWWTRWAPAPTGLAASIAPGGPWASIAFTFTAPDDDGARPMTGGYYLRCTSPDYGTTGRVEMSSPTTLTPLWRGTTYTCTVTGSTSAGSTRASAPVTVVVPPAAPDVAGSVTASSPAVGQSTDVHFGAPSYDGGSAITEFTATCTSGTGATRSASGATSPIAVGSLTKGADYTCTVTATNGVGTSVASAASGTVSVPATEPDAPVSVAASAGPGGITVTWSAPGAGGSPITGYTVTASPGGAVCAAPVTTCTFTDLAPGGSYAFTVRATNAVGTSSPSAPSSAVAIPLPPSVSPAPSATPSSPPAPAPAVFPAASPRRLTLGRPTAARTLAEWAGLKVPKGGKVTLRVPRSQAKRCGLRGGAVVATAPGVCSVTVTVTPRKGARRSRTITVGS